MVKGMGLHSSFGIPYTAVVGKNVFRMDKLRDKLALSDSDSEPTNVDVDKYEDGEVDSNGDLKEDSDNGESEVEENDVPKVDPIDEKMRSQLKNVEARKFILLLPWWSRSK